MSALAWFIIVIVALAGIVGAYCFTEARGYKRGYAAGQYAERRAVHRVLNEIRQRGLRAESDIDYLYERARWQITQSSAPDEAQGNGSDE